MYCGPKVCIHGFIVVILGSHLRNQIQDIELFQEMVKSEIPGNFQLCTEMEQVGRVWKEVMQWWARKEGG